MTYQLFIDDERFPPNDNNCWIIAKTSEEAIQKVKDYGFPAYISFDHDLGGEDTSRYFVKWLMNMVIDGKLRIPPGFGFYVHSQNPVGRDWIFNNITSLVYHFGDENGAETSTD